MKRSYQGIVKEGEQCQGDKMLCLSKGAVVNMLQGGTYAGPYVVSVAERLGSKNISDDNAESDEESPTIRPKMIELFISDDRHSAAAFFPLDLYKKAAEKAAERKCTRRTKPNIVARVTGYVTSTSNYLTQDEPFLYITDCDFMVLQTVPKNYFAQVPTCEDIEQKERQTSCASFVFDLLPLLSLEDLAGDSRLFMKGSQGRQDYQKDFFGNLQTTEAFCGHTAAMATFDGWYSQNMEEANNHNHNHNLCGYQPGVFSGILNDLISSEVSEGLREQLAGAGFFGESNGLNSLLKRNMTIWNAIVYQGSNSTFNAFSLNEWAEILRFSTLRGRNEGQITLTNSWLEASVVFFALTESRPFGHEESTQKSFTSYMTLQMLGCPGLIDEQAQAKLELEAALSTTKRNLSLVYRGEECEGQQRLLLEAAGAAGFFFPLLALLVKRCAKTSQEVARLVRQKEQTSLDRIRQQAINQAREETKAEPCLICFEELPNISTLCCNKGVHWDCLFRWLNDNQSCPQCRRSMPRKLTQEATQATQGNVRASFGFNTGNNIERIFGVERLSERAQRQREEAQRQRGERAEEYRRQVEELHRQLEDNHLELQRQLEDNQLELQRQREESQRRLEEWTERIRNRR